MFHDRFPTWARARGLSRGLAALLVLATPHDAVLYDICDTQRQARMTGGSPTLINHLRMPRRPKR